MKRLCLCKLLKATLKRNSTEQNKQKQNQTKHRTQKLEKISHLQPARSARAHAPPHRRNSTHISALIPVSEWYPLLNHCGFLKSLESFGSSGVIKPNSGQVKSVGWRFWADPGLGASMRFPTLGYGWVRMLMSDPEQALRQLQSLPTRA